MKNLLVLLVVIVAVGVGVGFYRGWWSFASDSGGSTVHLNVSVDKEKIQEDKKKAIEKVEEIGHQLKEKVAATTEKAAEQTPQKSQDVTAPLPVPPPASER